MAEKANSNSPRDRKSAPPPGGADGSADAEHAPPFPDVSKYVVRDPDAFARNLARMTEQAGKAAAAWLAARESGQKQDAMAEPLADIVKTFSKVTEYWLSDPSRALEAQTRLFSSYMGIWASSVKKMAGEPVEDDVVPARGDKRFKDADWGEIAFYDFLKKAYLVTSRWAMDLVDEAEGLDNTTRHKADFYMRQIAEAMSPSNFAITNPEVLRETVESNGANLVRGMKMLAEDIELGKGELKLRQSDASKFALGKNIALTPGKVIAQSKVAQIVQYEAATDKVLKRPLLICPPWINKFYILDLNPEKSFIRWAVEQGHSVFVISWVNPDKRHARMGWEDYIRDGLQFGLDVVQDTTGSKKINTIGYCVGGTLLSAALALLARDGDNRVASATLFTTQVDFEHAGDLKVFVDHDQVAAIERAMQDKGYLDGTRMATAFNMLRSGDLIWPYVVNNYMRGKNPMPFDLLYWNSDSTRMSAANHSFYLRNCYLENNLSRDAMMLDGAPVSLSDIKVPIYNLATREDHIAPARSVFIGSQFFGSDVTYVLAGSGHIAGVVNPPAANKYQYWVGGPPEGEYADWVEAAEECEGSWWPHWDRWIRILNDRQVEARDMGSKNHPPLEDAPGSYVKVRV